MLSLRSIPILVGDLQLVHQPMGGLVVLPEVAVAKVNKLNGIGHFGGPFLQ
jgi:hypothetical protein